MKNDHDKIIIEKLTNMELRQRGTNITNVLRQRTEKGKIFRDKTEEIMLKQSKLKHESADLRGCAVLGTLDTGDQAQGITQQSYWKKGIY